MSLKYFSIKDTKEEAHRKYKALAHLYHPDKSGGDNTIMREINVEYNLIIKDKIPKDDPVSGHDQNENVKKNVVNEEILHDLIDLGSILFTKNRKNKEETFKNLLNKYGMKL